METSGIKYVKSKKGMLRIGIISIGFLTFILVVSAPYCEGALLWVALAFLLSAIASLGSFILSVKAWTQKIQIGIPYQVIIYKIVTRRKVFHNITSLITKLAWPGDSERYLWCGGPSSSLSLEGS